MTSHSTKALRCSNCTNPVHEVPVDYDLGDPVTCGARCSASLAIAASIKGLRVELQLIDRALEDGRTITEEERRVVREHALRIDSDASAWNEAVGENGGGS